MIIEAVLKISFKFLPDLFRAHISIDGEPATRMYIPVLRELRGK